MRDRRASRLAGGRLRARAGARNAATARWARFACEERSQTAARMRGAVGLISEGLNVGAFR
eukprot:3464048-Pyramimonas_sp.AAC.1